MRFEDYHPGMNLLFFLFVIGGALYFKHPVLLAVGFVCAFIYSVKKCGARGAIFNTLLIPCAVAFGAWYAFYHHFGVTWLRRNFIGNRITLESILYGLTLGFLIATVIMWTECVLKIFTADKIVFLTGRVSPRISLFISIILRAVPRIIEMGKKINRAQQGIGRGINQGNIFRRSINLVRVLSMLVTWSLESFVTSSESMRCRGYTLRGRTSFSIYRFDMRDRSFVITLFFFFTVVFTGVLLDQHWILFDPQILINKITPYSFVFYVAYMALCLVPFVMEVISEKQFDRLRKMGVEE